MTGRGRKDIRAQFGKVVNMTPSESERWLETASSKGVGRPPEGADESVGHQEGRRTVAIPREKAADLVDGGFARARRVTG